MADAAAIYILIGMGLLALVLAGKEIKPASHRASALMLGAILWCLIWAPMLAVYIVKQVRAR